MLAAQATLRATVPPSPATATLVAGAPGAIATLTATVTGERVRAFEAPATATTLRVKLAGEWISAEDIVGPVSIRRSIDSPRATATLTLAGNAYGFLRTLSTWTLTPAEVWRLQRGDDGSVVELLELRGRVLPGSRQTDGANPTVSITIDDSAELADSRLCFEVPPLSGFRRGAILRQLAAGAGVTKTRIPEGRVFNKPLFTDNQPVLRVLRELGDPEGWAWRRVDDGTGELVLEAYVARIKAAPQPPDHVWAADRIESIEVEAPADVPHRIIVRGLGAVTVEEDGTRVERTTTEIRAPYAPVPAVARQASDGTQTAVAATSVVADRVVRRIEVEERFRGEAPTCQETREYGWHNPRAPRLEARGDRNGPVGGFYWAGGSYIAADGSYRQWSIQRFVQISARRVEQVYDGGGNQSGTITEEDGWFSITMAVANTSGAEVSGAVIGDDDQSYETPLERYGRRARHEQANNFDSATGAVTSESTRTFGWYSPRAAVSISGFFLRYNGEARKDLKDQWLLTGSQRIDRSLTSDSLESGRVITTQGFKVAERLGGAHDYGGGVSSDQGEEVFRTLQTESVLLNRRNDGTVEEVSLPADGPPTSRIVSGSLPLPRFELSPWTRLVQEPIELLLQDDTLQALFGGREVTLSSDYLTGVAEAESWARHTLSRLASFRVSVTRPYTPALPGDTILVVSPDDGLTHRALLVDVDSSDNLVTGESTGRYLLEVPFL